MKDTRGFTLLELLMVVIIIAILASIALPQYIRATEKARAAEAFQILGAVRQSEGRYKAQSATNVFSANSQDLDMMDAANPETTKSWGTVPNGLLLTLNSSALTRNGGMYAAKVLGIRHDNGQVCGSFAVSSGIDATAPAACP